MQMMRMALSLGQLEEAVGHLKVLDADLWGTARVFFA